MLSQADALRADVEVGEQSEHFADVVRIAESTRKLHQHVVDLSDPARIRAAMEGTDEFLSWQRIRHDLRSTINAIKGYSEPIIEDLEDGGTDGLRTGLERLLNVTHRVLARVDGVSCSPATIRENSFVPKAVGETRIAPPIRRRITDGSRVLVIDDTEENRDLLARWLQLETYRVDTADRGERGVAMLREDDYDLVLLDLVMPGMDGFGVLAAIQENEVLRDIPVIVISAVDEIDSVVGCLQAGAEDYLTKPFNRVLLRARLRASLEKKKWRDRQRLSVETLVRAMRRVERGDLSTALDDAGQDVYAQLFRGFNLMVEGLRDEARLLEVTRDLAGEIHLDLLLQRIMRVTSEILDADRSTLFVYDAKTDELWSRVAEGLGEKEIRIPADSGIAGHVFQTGQTENVNDPYSHPLFNAEVDRKTGYVTRSILCMLIVSKTGQRIGVTQVLNKRGGQFVERDEQRLSAFTAQVAVSLENAKLFDDVLNIKNYNESILKSTSNGLITLDTKREIVTINEAAAALMQVSPVDVVGKSASQLFSGANEWLLGGLDKVATTGEVDLAVDADLSLPDGNVASINLSTVPLIDISEESIGSMLIIEDISGEKRVRATMARYMSKEVADQLLAGDGSELGGKDQAVSILFSDIRRFTSISEALGARDTVALLNDYFAEMVDVVLRHKGILDKYIGDAIMALFGAPFDSPHDADNAVDVADEMIRVLSRFNKEHVRPDHPKIEIGIGIGTGEVVAGNIGSPKRMEYTVIGDSVNIASRLEGANKFYGTNILLCEHTASRLSKQHRLREIDLLRVKGRDEPLAVFESLGHHSRETFPEFDRVLEAYGRGLACYRNRDFAAGLACFERALSLNPADAPSRMYLERCQGYAEIPPPPDWDRVWQLTSK